MLGTIFMDLAIALGIGLLVGLQKERAASPLAGLRTFGLISLFGATTALIATRTDFWVLAVGLLAITILMVLGNVVMMRQGDVSPGQTTEVAVLLTFLTGALVVIGPREVAIVLGATTAILLHLREELRSWATRLSDSDVRAVMQFVVISLIILPILPDRTYGPYDVLNPRQIWLMVVLIVGLNLAGYAAFRIMGERAGTALTGVLGGVISSTATTLSYARLTKTTPGHAKAAVVVVWIASGVVFARILIEISAVAPGFLPAAAGPISLMLVLFAVAAGLIWKSATGQSESPLEPTNPSELRPAIIFGALYGTVLFVIAAAEALLGNVGLFAAAGLSGLTDIDAITLSTSQLVVTDIVEPATGWRLILVAAMSNMAFKLMLAMSLGSPQMARRLAVLFSIAIAFGTGLIFVWP